MTVEAPTNSGRITRSDGGRLSGPIRRAVLAVLVLGLAGCGTVKPPAGSREAGEARMRSLVPAAPMKYVLTPEGEFVAVFHPLAEEWAAKRLTAADVKGIREGLAASTRIDLLPNGLASAATRDTGGAKDPTNYDAVWVRDAAWAYHALVETADTRADARRLVLALWDSYATRAQLGRFDAVIASPAVAADRMKVVHIRFNGRSPDLDDVKGADGKPELWNHRQNDAHGLFLLSLADAVARGLVAADDLTETRFAALLRFPPYLDAIRFETFEDAGAWEEIDRRNTSSIGLVANALQRWRSIVDERGEASPSARFGTALRERLARVGEGERGLASCWTAARLDGLVARGLATVKRQLALGGESPDYPPDDLRFRRADAYLLSLIVPAPLPGLAEAELRQALALVETLKRPAGVLRYVNDSYQSGNSWLVEAAPETGDASPREAFLARMKKLLPHTEAEWFFDSVIALARLQLMALSSDPQQRRQDLLLAGLHLKRALGQLTGDREGSRLVDAQGARVAPLLLPESVNTVVLDGKRHYLPSPIVPLNWAKATLKVALVRYEQALAQAEAGR